MAKIYYKVNDKIFENFDNYEIWPCLIIEIADDGEIIYEVCDDDNPSIAIWCVYGHLLRGGLECISDHNTIDDAQEFKNSLPSLYS